MGDLSPADAPADLALLVLPFHPACTLESYVVEGACHFPLHPLTWGDVLGLRSIRGIPFRHAVLYEWGLLLVAP